jgi:hypothetical protein
MIKEKIVIDAKPEVVLEAIRKLRSEHGRKLTSYDGKLAIINEKLEDVPVYGRVDCIWHETEHSDEHIEFKMVSSSKFKESYGNYKLSSTNGRTTLEISVHMDAGINIPFAAEMTKASTSKDTKIRLEKIKRSAEDIQKQKQV